MADAHATPDGRPTPRPRFFRQQFASDLQVDRSLRHSLWDGMFFSAMIGSAESYFAAFAVFLKGTTTQIGMLASLPPLLGSLMQVVSAWLGRRIGRRRGIIVFGAVVQAATLIPLLALPAWMPELALPVLILCSILYFAGPHLGAPQWGSLMGDLVPDSRRGRFFALRTRLSSLAHFASLALAGVILEVFNLLDRTYWGFAAIFAIAAFARLASAWHLSHMLDPPGHTASIESPLHREIWAGLKETGLYRFTAFFTAMQFSVAIASPFFALYMLRDLEFGYLAFMFNSAVSICVQFITLNRWGRLSDLFGNRLILVTTGLIIPVLPALWLVSTSYVYLLVVQVLSGVTWAGFTLSAGNTVYDLTPRDRRATLMAVHNVCAAAGLFVGAVVGSWLGTHLPADITVLGKPFAWLTPLYGVFVVSSVCRAVVAGAFLRRLTESRRVRPMTRRGLIFRVTRVTPLSGLNFEIVGRERPVPPEPGEGGRKV